MPSDEELADKARQEAEAADGHARWTEKKEDFAKAAHEWAEVATRWKRLAERDGGDDWCQAAEALAREADDVMAQRALEKNPSDANSLLRDANRLYLEAAECYAKCADAAEARGEHEHAAATYAKAAGYERRVIAGEKAIEEYYKRKKPQEAVEKYQAEAAAKRAKEADERRKKYVEKQHKSKQKALEIALAPVGSGLATEGRA